ncbi:MAG: polysaccharide pyruvyl transferase family protein [Lachnospiraceae bacterium]|nr:polysaccharide pyruvyl transferase family protein [Lachnospiraceae bacterium]
MKKIVLMGLVDLENYGEQFLADTVEYLVGRKYQAVSVDFRPPKKNLRHLLYWILLVLSKVFSFSQKSYKLLFWGISLLTRKYYAEQIKNADMIIFACGSYKYRTQKLWAYYSVAIEEAQKLNIPVMFDAMNIQNFDESDWRCRCLQTHTNYPCVKCFTTRDGVAGLEKLKRYYINRDSDIKVEMVGDPAFWIPECYDVQKSNSAKKVGVNLIRSKIFLQYGYNVTEEQLIDFYCNVIHKLEDSGIEWELFTNGLEKDYQLGKTVLKKCGMEERNIVVPDSAKQLVKLIAGYKAILGARLHSCICAYALDVPLVGFIWDEKLLRFSQIAGIESFFLTEGELDAEQFYTKFMVALDFTYDKIIREEWKQKTKCTIQQFLMDDA